MPTGRTPLRESRFRIITFSVGPIVGILIAGLVLVPRVVDGSLSAGLVVVALLIMLAVVAGSLALGFWIGNRLVGSRIEMGFRRPGMKWRQARATPSSGRIELQPYWWQLRIPAGEPLMLDVVDIAEQGRKPRPGEWWHLNPQTVVVALHTSDGEYELAVLPSHLDELRERVASPSAA